MSPTAQFTINDRHNEIITKHLEKCWSVKDTGRDDIAIVKLGSKRNANGHPLLICSLCSAEHACNHKQMILDSVLIEFFTETNQSEPVTSQSPVKFDPTCGDFVCSSNDFVSSGCKRDLFLVGAGDDHDKPFLYGAPQEFKIWQYKNMDSIVHVIGSHEPCHSLENAQYPPTFQDFIIFDLGGAALISIEVCRICGRSRTAVDDCYDLFLCKARLPADKITLKNKVGFGITMVLPRHFCSLFSSSTVFE